MKSIVSGTTKYCSAALHATFAFGVTRECTPRSRPTRFEMFQTEDKPIIILVYTVPAYHRSNYKFNFKFFTIDDTTRKGATVIC